MRQGRGRFGATGKALRQTRDSIADIWGERTGFYGEDQWPARVDEALIEEPDRWVQSACVLCSNGCALDTGVKDGRIVGVRGRGSTASTAGVSVPRGCMAGGRTTARTASRSHSSAPAQAFARRAGTKRWISSSPSRKS